MNKVKVRKIGNSYGIIIPKELLVKYNIDKDDELTLMENANGFEISPYNPEFQEWDEAFKETNKLFKNTLKKLSE